MIGPYYTTLINTETCVPPNQLNSNILVNIKQNLIRKHKGRCFNSYGCIMDIYSVSDKIGDGMTRPEDNSGSAYYNVEFKAKICNPMNNELLVARVKSVNKHIICAVNGPIVIMIMNDSINTEKFRYNNSKEALFPLNKDKKELNNPIDVGTYIMVRVRNKCMAKGDNKIVSLGTLEDLANHEQVMANMKNEMSNDDEITKLQEILERDMKAKQEKEDGATDGDDKKSNEASDKKDKSNETETT